MNPAPQHKLDPRIRSVWRISDAIWIILAYAVVVIPVFLIVNAGGHLPLGGLIFWILTGIFVALIVLCLLILPPLRYVRWRYQLNDDYLDIAKGIVWRERIIVPFIRVQNTDTKQGPIMRAFGLASVTVSTAAGEHVIPGLAVDQAEELRDRAAELARIAREDM